MKKFYFIIFLLIPLIVLGQAKSMPQKTQLQRLFVKTFEIGPGISSSFAEKLKDKLVLYFFEEGAGKYRIISEDDIRIMYQKAEELLKSGCDAEECLTQIAYAIDADIIVYGKLEKTSEGKINLWAQKLLRDRETDELIKQSIVNVLFYESQLDWFAKEIVKKLINPSYYIDVSKAPLEIKVKVAPESLETPKFKTAELKILKFRTDDTALSAIIDILKNEIATGDEYYKNKEYENAREKYKEVINKIETKLSSEKQAKLVDFKDEIYERISASYSAEFDEKVKEGDRNLKEGNYKIASAIYKEVRNEIVNEDQIIRGKLINWLNLIEDRMDLVTVNYAKQDVIEGDDYYSKYEFEKAIEKYNNALYLLGYLKTEKKEYKSFKSEIEEKRKIAEITGRSYFKNNVQSYCDRIEVFNLKGNINEAKEIFYQLEKYIKNSIFSDSESKNKLKEMESLLLKNPEFREEQEKKREIQEWNNAEYAFQIEIGAGHIINLFLSGKGKSYSMNSYGAGFSCSWGSYEGLDTNLLNLSFIFDRYLVQYNYFWINLRVKFGLEWLIMNQPNIEDEDNDEDNDYVYSERGLFLSANLIIGYHYFFIDFGFPSFYGKKGFGSIFQPGIGLCFKF